MVSEGFLQLHDYGVAFGDRVILRGVDLCLPERGMTVLVGPSGTGKSTLLRTLSGLNDASPRLRQQGDARYRGAPLGELERPAIVVQKTRLMMASLRENLVNEMPERESLGLAEQRDIAARFLAAADLGHLVGDLERCVLDLSLGEQRLVALVRTLAANPKMVFVDEPTAGVGEAEAERILACLDHAAQQRSVVTVVHNRKQALRLGGTAVLLAGGAVAESQPTADFFSAPRTALGRDFVRTGSCCAPSPHTAHDQLDERFAGQVADRVEPIRTPATAGRRIRSDAYGPRNFLWLLKGQLAGMPRPGMFLDVDLDLEALRRVGVTIVVSLESEVAPLPADTLARYGMSGLHLPIPDMRAPTLEEAEQLCTEIAGLIERGESVALHCKAGMGRTGTLLVACLIHQGQSALNALEAARKIEPRWVQSHEQVNFLARFEAYCRGRAENGEAEGLLASEQ